MKIVLREDSPGLGRKGDVVEVADGYGRNFLVAAGKALKATKGTVLQAESMRRSRELREVRDRESAEQVAAALADRVVTVEGRAGAGGKLFGSVGAADILAAVQSQAGVQIDRRKLAAQEPIRSLGRHEIPVRLHPDVETTLVVEVVAAGS